MSCGIVLLLVAGACLAVSAHAQDDGGDYFGGSGDGSDFGAASWGPSSDTVVDPSAWSGSLSQGFLGWQPALVQWQNGPSLADQVSSFESNLQTTVENAVLGANQWEQNVITGAKANPWGAGAALVDFGVGVAVGVWNPGLAASLFLSTGTSLVNSAFNDKSLYDGISSASGGASITLDQSAFAGNVWTGLGGLQSLQDLSALGANVSNPPVTTFSVEPVEPLPQLDSTPSDSQLLQLRRDAAVADQMVQDAQAALDAQQASLNAQQAATDMPLQDSQLPPNANTSIPWALGSSGQYQTATAPDPIEGSWVVSSNTRGCDDVEGTSGIGLRFGIVRQGPNTFLLNSEVITRIAPGTYVFRPRLPNYLVNTVQSWEDVLRVSGSTLQVSETMHYNNGPLTGYRPLVCTEQITARKQ